MGDEIPQIAIDGGIVGLILAAGLTRRGIKVNLYEQARNFREIGAGIGFTANTVRCMEKINPGIVKALRSGGAVNVSLDQRDPKSYLRWVDGYGQQSEDDLMYQKPLLKLDAGVKGWETVRRDQFLDDLVKVVPDGVVHLQKRLDTIEDDERSERMFLNFTDGTRTQADAGMSGLPPDIFASSSIVPNRDNQSSPPTVSSPERDNCSSAQTTPPPTPNTLTKWPTAP